VSRLDSFIRRLNAQRACLDKAAALVADIDGPILELGLGNGRTYDHLREHLPGREIFVFERKVAAHPDCIPDCAHLFEDDIRKTLPTAMQRIGSPVSMVHCDIGSGDKDLTAQLGAFIGPQLGPMLAPGAVVASDQPLEIAGCTPLALPDGVREGRYYMYCKTGA
jgi:hypothetical protein